MIIGDVWKDGETPENDAHIAKSISHLFRDYVRLQWISTVDQYDADS